MTFEPSHSASTDFWSNKLLPHFDEMLLAGNYTPSERKHHADFFTTWITSFLGPRPLAVDSRDTHVVDSHICDNHTPLNFSLSWKPLHRRPIVKYCIEPLPFDGRTGPVEVVSYGIHVLERLQQHSRSGSGSQDHLFADSYLCFQLLQVLGLTHLNDQWIPPPSISNIFLAFDLLPNHIETEAHLIFRSSLDRNEKLTLLSKAMSVAHRGMPWSAVMDYLQSKPEIWQTTYMPDPTVVAVDCDPCDDARIKVYFRYQFTDMDSLVDQLSLGGTIRVSEACIASLHQLWLRRAGSKSNPLLCSSHGIILYYDLRANSALPSVKVYFPVCLVADNDFQIANEFSRWLGNQSRFSNQSWKFLDTIQKNRDDQGLSRSGGTSMYIGLTCDSQTEGYPSVHFNPRIFPLQYRARSAKKRMATVATERIPWKNLLNEAGVVPCEIPKNCPSIAQTWFEAFTREVCGSGSGLTDIFVANGFWRDLVAFSPDIRTIHPRSSICTFLNDRRLNMRPMNFKLGPNVTGRTLPDSLTVIQGTFFFQTCIGHCSGVFTLVPNPLGCWKALTIVVTLDKLRVTEARFKDRAILQRVSLPEEPLDTNLGHPTVVVIGAGQAGLAAAAYLEDLGIPTLVIEHRARVGDCWRHRYESLNINTPKDFSQMPFVPFPSDWPMFPGSRAIANHLEAYPKVLGLRVLTSTTVSHTSHDSASGVWTLRLCHTDSHAKIVRSRHIVVATGVDSLAGPEPRFPNIPNASDFQGTVLHSSEFMSGKPWSGKKAIVIGAGCSGHDIAQELHRQGAAAVTIVQRSPIAVVSRKLLLALFPDLYTGDNRPPISVADRLFLSFPTPITRSLQHEVLKLRAIIDQELINGLRQSGFLLPDDNDNFFERLMIKRAGYYIDQGCSSLIMNGQVKLKAGTAITRYTPFGVLFADGTEVEADLIVCATGFLSTSPIDRASKDLSYDLAKEVKAVGGWDDEYEVAGLWRPTGHRGMWFAGGDLFACRVYARLLAMQIKAEEEGLFRSPKQKNEENSSSSESESCS